MRSDVATDPTHAAPGLGNHAKPATSRSQHRRRWTLLLRTCVALGLLTALAMSLDLERVLVLFRDLRAGWVLAFVPLVLIVRFITAVRWQVLLTHVGIEVSVYRLVQVIFISMFLGQFLPGSVGPDLVRGYWVARRRGTAGAVAVSLVADRVVGMYAFISVALVGCLVAGSRVPTLQGLVPWLAVLQLLALGCWLACYRLGARWAQQPVLGGRELPRRVEKGLQAVASVTQLSRTPVKLAWLFLLSGAIVVLRCCMFFVLYLAFGVHVPFGLMLFFVPVLFVVVLIPVSISGLGVREATLAYLLGMAGVAAEVSVSVGLLFQLLQVAVSLPGGALWLGEKRGIRGPLRSAPAD